jgi:hypothetical protein
MPGELIVGLIFLGFLSLTSFPFWGFPLMDSIGRMFDSIGNGLSNFRLNRTRSSTANKMLILKLLSTDPKEIERFVEINVSYLSHADITKLANRIEELRMDASIANDDLLKKRIADLEPVFYDPPAIKPSKGKRA